MDLKSSHAFGSFSVNDTNAAKKFYSDTLGLNVKELEIPGMLELNFPDNNTVFVYAKNDHTPATYTVLNFPVENIDKAVDELRGRGVNFESYDGEIETDAKGIHREKMMAMAWFKDPSGNILSVIEEKH
jgi:predicted enzyme related to lactoylglutathione lyase